MLYPQNQGVTPGFTRGRQGAPPALRAHPRRGTGCRARARGAVGQLRPRPVHPRPSALRRSRIGEPPRAHARVRLHPTAERRHGLALPLPQPAVEAVTASGRIEGH
jgi:hypothetical protein